MLAHWKILSTGEDMFVKVTLGFEAFVTMINSHPKMTFVEWIK